MRSMTGFGVGRAAFEGGSVVMEVRTVNHRFVDVRVRASSEISDQSFFIEQLVRERARRGRYDVTVRLEGVSLPLFDEQRARALYAGLVRLRDELAPGTEVPVTALMWVPNLVASAPATAVEELRQALTAAVQAAFGDLDSMRETEGARLSTDLSDRVGAASRLCARVGERAPNVTKALAERLRERLRRLVEDTSLALEPGRLETEVALLADRTDVTEELVRLDSHFVQFRALLGAGEPVGRRLDFLLQEMGREANTIGAKCQDAELSHLVVELKAEVERMREQVQNVE